MRCSTSFSCRRACEDNIEQSEQVAVCVGVSTLKATSLSQEPPAALQPDSSAEKRELHAMQPVGQQVNIPCHQQEQTGAHPAPCGFGLQPAYGVLRACPSASSTAVLKRRMPMATSAPSSGLRREHPSALDHRRRAACPQATAQEVTSHATARCGGSAANALQPAPDAAADKLTGA